MRLLSVKLCELAISVSILVCGGTTAAAQTGATVKSAPDRPRVRVDLSSFKQVGPTSGGRDFAAFFRTLTALQLRGVRGAEIDTLGGGPQCLRPPNAQAAQQASLPVLSINSSIPTVYVSATVTVDSARSFIEVEATRCGASALVRLLHTGDEIPTQDPLPKLLVLAGAIARSVDAQIPRPTVAVTSATGSGPGDSIATQFSAVIADRISQRLERDDDLRVSDSVGVNGADYSFATTARTLGSAGFEARWFLTIRGSSVPIDSVVLPGRRRDSLAAAVADSAVGRLAYWRSLGGLRSPVTNISAGDSASGLLALGRAEARRGNNRQALAAYQRALTSVGHEAVEGDVLKAIVSLYRDAGDYGSAIGPYNRLVEIFPRDSALARERTTNLRLARRNFEALRVLGSAVRDHPGWSWALGDFVAVLKGLDPRQVADSADVVSAICRADRVLAQSCYNALRAHAAATGADASSRSQLRSIARALVDVADTSAREIAESQAYLALAILGTPLLLYESAGRVRLQNPPNVSFDSASRALQIAAQSSGRAGDASLKEWVLRLRAQYALMKGDPDQSYNLAMQALAITPSTSGNRVAASAALLSTGRRLFLFPYRKRLATADSLITPMVQSGGEQVYLMFIQTKHALGQDDVARDTLQRIVHDFPANSNARWALAVVCNEFLHDYGCGYVVRRDAYVAGRLTSYADTVDAVEAALLVDSLEVARRWLAPALIRPAAPCEKAVAAIFAYWLAARQHDDAGLDAALRTWNDASASAKKTDRLNCWIFEGDKAFLGSDTSRLSPAARQMLLDMMRQIQPDAAPGAAADVSG
jgi:tetratricopeptide (TPR) repeat protein